MKQYSDYYYPRYIFTSAGDVLYKETETKLEFKDDTLLIQKRNGKYITINRTNTIMKFFRHFLNLETRQEIPGFAGYYVDDDFDIYPSKDSLVPLHRHGNGDIFIDGVVVDPFLIRCQLLYPERVNDNYIFFRNDIEDISHFDLLHKDVLDFTNMGLIHVSIPLDGLSYCNVYGYVKNSKRVYNTFSGGEVASKLVDGIKKFKVPPEGMDKLKIKERHWLDIHRA